MRMLCFCPTESQPPTKEQNTAIKILLNRQKVFFIFNYVKECVKLFVVTIFCIRFVIYVTVLPVHQKIYHSVNLHHFLIRFFIRFNRVVNIIMFTYNGFLLL